jgi:hypothetical protein
MVQRLLHRMLASLKERSAIDHLEGSKFLDLAQQPVSKSPGNIPALNSSWRLPRPTSAIWAASIAQGRFPSSSTTALPQEDRREKVS